MIQNDPKWSIGWLMPSDLESLDLDDYYDLDDLVMIPKGHCWFTWSRIDWCNFPPAYLSHVPLPCGWLPENFGELFFHVFFQLPDVAKQSPQPLCVSWCVAVFPLHSGHKWLYTSDSWLNRLPIHLGNPRIFWWLRVFLWIFFWTIRNSSYPLVISHMAMENPRTEWRFIAESLLFMVHFPLPFLMTRG